MNLIPGRCAILVLAVLAAACGDDCAYDSGLFGESATPPPLSLGGIWEGREAPFTTKDTYPWWQFDVEHDGSSGTFVTDHAFHKAGMKSIGSSSSGTVRTRRSARSAAR